MWLNPKLLVDLITFNEEIVKVNKSVYMAKSGQQYNKTPNDFSLHVSNHALKYMYKLSYGTINNTNILLYSSIEVLIDFIDSVIAI